MADLEEKKVVLTKKQENRAIYQKMLNMMLQKKSRAILKDVLKKSRKLLSMQRLLMKENLIILK